MSNRISSCIITQSTTICSKLRLKNGVGSFVPFLQNFPRTSNQIPKKTSQTNFLMYQQSPPSSKFFQWIKSLPSHSIDSQHQMCNVTKQHVKHRYATSIFIKCSVLSQPFKKKLCAVAFCSCTTHFTYCWTGNKYFCSYVKVTSNKSNLQFYITCIFQQAKESKWHWSCLL